MSNSALAMQPPTLVSTGIPGLDNILSGGLPPNRVYLVNGNPGAGKTKLALQFLLEGVRNGEAGLYVTLSETKEELSAVSGSHGWSLDSIHVHEMATNEQDLEPDNQYTMYQPSEVELNVTTKATLSEFERLKPTRVVLDSLSEIRLLAHEGHKALEIAQSYAPHIILLDIGLPGMNGYEICQALRKRATSEHCIIIAQTGWRQKEHVQRSKEAGFDYHLVKPVRLETLQEILEKINVQSCA